MGGVKSVAKSPESPAVKALAPSIQPNGEQGQQGQSLLGQF